MFNKVVNSSLRLILVSREQLLKLWAKWAIEKLRLSDFSPRSKNTSKYHSKPKTNKFLLL